VTSKPVYVLDSFALLSYLQGEAGMERIQSLLQEANKDRCHIFLCVINLGEVLYLVERERGMVKAHEILAAIQQLPIEIFPAETQTVLDAAHIKANHILSYADAFAVSCAQAVEGTVLTRDREFESVEQIVNVEWLPRNNP
jgi:predicted nucleic acid-binding protein